MTLHGSGGHSRRDAHGPWTLGELIDLTGAQLLEWRHPDVPSQDPLTALGRVSIDARTCATGDIFVALRGEHSHGVEHWEQAERNGASVLVVADDAPTDVIERALSDGHLTIIKLGRDSFDVIGRLGRAWRQRCGFDVVGVTGSSGKTSTKDILAALLAGQRNVVKSHANHNNEIGVPLTLLSAPAGTDVVICEMGMRGLGQIAYLCEVAEPDVGVVTNTGVAHLELLGTRENIVRAKAELLHGARRVGIAPAWQPELVKAAGTTPELMLFAREGDDLAADCHVLSAVHGEDGVSGELDVRGERVRFSLPLHGLHQATNLAAAVCAYLALGGDVARLPEAIADVRLTEGRGDRIALPGGGWLIDDAYNANPESMRVAIRTLAHLPGRKVAVLGYMAELGERLTPALHRHLGAYAAWHGVDELVVVGTESGASELAQSYANASGRPVSRFETVDEALAARGVWLRPGDAVLVKASNSVGLGRLASVLVETAVDQSGAGVASDDGGQQT